jgi:hypothetical protein
VTFPASALKKCPETLPQTDINEAAWKALTLKEQITVITKHAQGFALGYFKCSILHNTGVDAYQDTLKARQEWRAAQETETKEAKPWWKF